VTDAERLVRIKDACTRQNDEICQTLGKALGYPWYKDDQKNFPGATEANGVCVGEHVAESLAMEAARELAAAHREITTLKEDLEFARHDAETGHIFNRELQAEITRLKGEQWQPIETMPKDGPLVLVYWEKSLTGKSTTALIGPDEYQEIRGYGEPPATYWMPLPDPPVRGEIERRDQEDSARVVAGQPQASEPAGSTASDNEVKR
jgi:hypothetical protein